MGLLTCVKKDQMVSCIVTGCTNRADKNSNIKLVTIIIIIIIIIMIMIIMLL